MVQFFSAHLYAMTCVYALHKHLLSVVVEPIRQEFIPVAS